MNGPQLKPDAPTRSVTEVGPGDYVLPTAGDWQRIMTNSAAGARHAPRSWVVRTYNGRRLTPYGIRRYAKAEDLQPPPPQGEGDANNN